MTQRSILSGVFSITDFSPSEQQQILSSESSTASEQPPTCIELHASLAGPEPDSHHPFVQHTSEDAPQIFVAVLPLKLCAAHLDAGFAHLCLPTTHPLLELQPKAGDYLFLLLPRRKRLIAVLRFESGMFRDATYNDILDARRFPCQFQTTEILSVSATADSYLLTEIFSTADCELLQTAEQLPSLRFLRQLSAHFETADLAPLDRSNETDPEPSSLHTNLQGTLVLLAMLSSLLAVPAREDIRRLQKLRVLDRRLCFQSQLPTKLLLSKFKTLAPASTIRSIDMLICSEDEILSAIEVESTTSIYSGLLRFVDLAEQYTGAAIQYYVVIPRDREATLLKICARPAFQRFCMTQTLRYIFSDDLQQFHQKLLPVLQTDLKASVPFAVLQSIAKSV